MTESTGSTGSIGCTEQVPDSQSANGAAMPTTPSVARVMGLESEYGISVPGDPLANPMVASGLVVRSFGRTVAPQLGGRVVRWDYAGENPLADARGWTLERSQADPSMLTDEVDGDVRVANVVVPNGARLYVDHAHPEYSGPECLTPRETLIWDRAGEELAARAAAALTRDDLRAATRAGTELVLYKNNTDGKGASYGTHENYLVGREVPFGRIVAGLLPFFAVRQVLTGAGRVGLGQKSETPGFQIGARSDFMEALVGLETTMLRPMVNTRDEPHASPEKYRRLHVIIGDANLAEPAGLLKMGATSLVLGLIEGNTVPAGLDLADPLAELRAVSRDLTLTHRLTLTDGRRLTAVQLLREYLDACVSLSTDRSDAGTPYAADTDEVLRLWDETLTDLERVPQEGPQVVADRLDWAAKWTLLNRYRTRDKLDWSDPKLRAIDSPWSDLRLGKGLARALEKAGRLRRLTTDAEVAHALAEPPPSTRAWLRGTLTTLVPATTAASWETVLFDLPGTPRLRVAEPLTGTRAQMHDLFPEAPISSTNSDNPGNSASARLDSDDVVELLDTVSQRLNRTANGPDDGSPEATDHAARAYTAPDPH